MMMNLRGLILDDPDYTIHLQTLEFATRTDSEVEEIAPESRLVELHVWFVLVTTTAGGEDVREGE
jgi:hypothetical protein